MSRQHDVDFHVACRMLGGGCEFMFYMLRMIAHVQLL
jgi:hypothetical protein